MLFAQTKETISALENLLGYGALGVFAFVIGVTALVFFWKVYVPQYRESHKKRMLKEDEWIGNIGQQTLALKSIQDNLTTHTSVSDSQHKESVSHQIAVAASIDTIHQAQEAQNDALTAAVEHVRTAFREYAPDLGSRIGIEDTCNDLRLRLQAHKQAN